RNRRRRAASLPERVPRGEAPWPAPKYNPLRCAGRPRGGVPMLWEIEIRPLGHDGERERVCEEYNLLTHGAGDGPVAASARGYLLEGGLAREDAQRLLDELLVDPLVEAGRLGALNEPAGAGCLATVLPRPGVMDPAALSVVEASRDLGIDVQGVRSF